MTKCKLDNIKTCNHIACKVAPLCCINNIRYSEIARQYHKRNKDNEEKNNKIEDNE